MKSNLDVWAIQYHPEELLVALQQLKDGINIIYSNCTCDLKIGSQTIKNRQFDTILYNEESDILILLMRGGKATKQDIIKYLEKNNKQYGEVTFDSTAFDDYYDSDNVPELWFAREKYVLDDALEDSKRQNIMTCEFYPLIDGTMNLGYIIGVEEQISIDDRIFKGLLKLDDKLVLIINQSNNVDKKGKCRNMSVDDILNTMIEHNINYELIIDHEPNLNVNNFSTLRKHK